MLIMQVISRLKAVWLILFIIIFSALETGLRAEKTHENIPSAEDKARILILSKHLRLLKENKTGSIQLTLPRYCELDTGNNRFSCVKLSILTDGHTFSIKTENSIFNRGEFTLYPSDRGSTFTADINGEKRIYPLPLKIKFSGSDIELSIEETIDRFAIDSAYAEFGNITEKQSEALYALAHLIKARCRLPYLTGKHNGYHFCDLTCCQSYKGITGKIFNDDIYINTESITSGLFFHASSGGTLFTETIFNNHGRNFEPPKDIIYSENLTLSRNRHNSWKAKIDSNELVQILYPAGNINLKKINFDRDKEITLVETDAGSETIPPESFRIRVNRIKGWNFIKSNNYHVSENNGVYEFTGSGMGHCTGMSLEGALQLAERGFSRYEILEHYYPSLEFKSILKTETNHYLQYIAFDYTSGEVINSRGGTSFRNRIIPCGSIFKLFIALYLAEQRPDLFYNYTFNCTESTDDKNLPANCWQKEGHGKMNISRALYHSCNRYFASLYSNIDPADFRRWILDFTMKHGIEMTLPETRSKKDFSALLAGLNFNITISVDGIIKLNRYIFLESTRHHSGKIYAIFSALHKTFTEGTAKNSREKINLLHLKNSGDVATTYNSAELWGKTGTVIAGTNKHHGYGIFTGGSNSSGIVAVIRKGTGSMAAWESEKILFKKTISQSQSN